MGYFEVLDRIKPQVPAPEPIVPPLTVQPLTPVARQTSRALVIDAPDKTVITVSVETASLDPEDFLTRISGRLVGAEEANSNGQFWTTADLEFGVNTVSGGPLNWLHDDRKIIGSLVDAQLVAKHPATAAAADTPTHIKADSVVWSYIYPSETAVIREAAAAKKLYYSMECISKNVECAGPNGCGQLMTYADAHHKTEKACEHVRARASHRRFINPIFQGSAVIVPPVQPGWSNANADLIRRASASRTGQQASEFTDDEVLAAQILQFVGGR